MSTATLQITPEQERRQRAREHVQAVVDRIVSAEPEVLFGFRNGPCVVEYRDWWQRGWPQTRAFSCLGCKHHERGEEYGTNYCAHPLFLAKHGCHQSVAHNNWWRPRMAEVHAFSCPVLRQMGVNEHCPLPDDREPIPGRERSKVYRRTFPNEEAEIFSIPQHVPYYVRDAYERGENVDKQHPTY